MVFATFSFVIPVLTALKNDRAILKTMAENRSPWMYTLFFPLFAIARSIISVGYFMADRFSNAFSLHDQVAAVSSMILFSLDCLIWYFLGKFMEQSMSIRLGRLTIITAIEGILFIGFGMIVPKTSYGILHFAFSL